MRHPVGVLRRSEQRLGNRAPVDAAPQVDDQQAIVEVNGREEPQRERVGRQHASVEGPPPRLAERDVFAPDAQQIAVQRVHRRVRVAFVRHATRHTPPTWKLSGFLDIDHDSVVTGGEALKRLNGAWR